MDFATFSPLLIETLGEDFSQEDTTRVINVTIGELEVPTEVDVIILSWEEGNTEATFFDYPDEPMQLQSDHLKIHKCSTEKDILYFLIKEAVDRNLDNYVGLFKLLAQV